MFKYFLFHFSFDGSYFIGTQPQNVEGLPKHKTFISYIKNSFERFFHLSKDFFDVRTFSRLDRNVHALSFPLLLRIEYKYSELFNAQAFQKWNFFMINDGVMITKVFCVQNNITEANVLKRSYMYCLSPLSLYNPFKSRYITFYNHFIDRHRTQEIISLLLSFKNFGLLFNSSNSNYFSRPIQELSIEVKENEDIVIKICGKSFFRHMVRYTTALILKCLESKDFFYSLKRDIAENKNIKNVKKLLPNGLFFVSADLNTEQSSLIFECKPFYFGYSFVI